jgi:hypothetical protein
MGSRKVLTLVAAVVFLLVGLAGFYRLMVGFPITIGNQHLGQTSSFFVFVACVGLSIALFRQSRTAH